MGRLMKWTPIEKDVLSELYLVQELSAQKIAKDGRGKGLSN